MSLISQVGSSALRPSLVPGMRPTAQSAERKDGQAPSDPNAKPGSPKQPGQLSDADQETIRKLKARDTEVRAHEQAHASTGGSYAGSPSFEYQRGPDGRNYAIGGEVPIDVSAIAGDPQATITKMMQVQRAALAPQEPSGPDRAIAAMAARQIIQARQEMMAQGSPNASGKQASGSADGKQEARAASNDQGNEDAAQAGAFVAFQRRNASHAAYSAAASSRGAGGGMDRHA